MSAVIRTAPAGRDRNMGEKIPGPVAINGLSLLIAVLRNQGGVAALNRTTGAFPPSGEGGPDA
jgi:hypothetical protein